MKIVIYVYNGITMLDAFGPYEVLRNMKDAEVTFVAKKKGEIKSDSGDIILKVKNSIKDVDEADILLIPGSTITFVKEMKNEKVLEWIKAINETTTWTTSVCTGSIILAATGLLENKEATSHWKSLELLKEFDVKPVHERVVVQGKFVTSAGVSAGIDMAFFLADKIVGALETQAIQLMLEYDPKPRYDGGKYKEANNDVMELAEEKLHEQAKHELGLLDKLFSWKTLRKLK